MIVKTRFRHPVVKEVKNGYKRLFLWLVVTWHLAKVGNSIVNLPAPPAARPLQVLSIEICNIQHSVEIIDCQKDSFTLHGIHHLDLPIILRSSSAEVQSNWFGIFLSYIYVNIEPKYLPSSSGLNCGAGPCNLSLRRIEVNIGHHTVETTGSLSRWTVS